MLWPSTSIVRSHFRAENLFWYGETGDNTRPPSVESPIEQGYGRMTAYSVENHRRKSALKPKASFMGWLDSER
jgi:hypothetical protein